MDYIKYTFTLTPNNKNFRDILSAELGTVGFESFIENNDKLEAFISLPNNNTCLLEQIDFSELFSYTFETETIPDKNWNKEWENNYFTPLLIANTCLIRAPFHKDYPDAKYEIIIEPKMAFGTGNHETTSLMIEHILELDFTDKNVLDMGCGTGILSILASYKGANSITAIDIDQWSYESTIENSYLNNCKNITAIHGDASALNSQKFDIIFANIHKNILLNDLKKYNSVLNKGGILIMSGFYEADLIDIENATKNLDINNFKKKVRNKWVAASFIE